jgi:hypothetical protein
MTLFARLFAWLRRKPPQPVFDEREAYDRFYGERNTEIVVTPKPPPGPRVLPKLRGDYLRRCFEERLERRHGVGPAESADEGPVELLRREAAAAGRESRSDEVIAAGLDARVDG